MLDDKIELGKIGGGIIDVADIEGVGTQRINCRPFVYVDVLGHSARYLYAQGSFSRQPREPPRHSAV
jgi:hypothetical protein